MKKVKKLPIIILLIMLTALLAVSLFRVTGVKTAMAYDEYIEYTSTYLSEYRAAYDIKSNRSMSVEEDITVSFDRRSGFIKYIPVNAGEQVKHIKVYEKINDTLTDIYYDVSYEDSAVFLDIGDKSIKNTKHTYRITYDYCLTKAQEGENLLALTPIGADWPCKIENIYFEMKLPQGYVGNSAKFFVNYYGTVTGIEYEENISSDGRTVLTAYKDKVAKGSEVRVDMSFNDGVLSTYTDTTPYIFLIPAFILLAAIILLKLFIFNKNKLMPVVNYEAPDKIDPLIMGKLIDNKVNSEDVTSLIYYWAGKGYIKINLDDKDDPVLIRIIQHLPLSCPDYERYMYDSLFRSGDAVRPSQLKNSFYKVIEQTTAMVNRHTKGLYDNKSIGISVLFAVLGGLLLGFAPMILALTTISSKMLIIAPFIALVPALILYAFAETIKYYSLKFSRGKLILLSCGIALLCCITGLLYVVLIPNCIIGLGAKIALYIVSALIFTSSVILISRTKEYTDKLNDILGFKNFIRLAEKAQLEMMLEQDPQFYYHILPYAQVLGVTDKWEEKFKDLTVEPPQWLTGNVVTTYFEFRILNGMLRNSMGRITSGMVSRPSSSGRSGGNHGGSFGGFSGGGHGGGGGRFR